MVFFATLAGTVWLLMVTPKGLFPQEDIGQLSVSTEARQDVSFEAMVACSSRWRRRIESRRTSQASRPSWAAPRSTPARCTSSSSRAASGLRCRRCWRTCAATPAHRRHPTVAVPVQNLRIGGRSSKAEYQFVVQGLNRPQLYEYSQKMADAMSRDPLFADVNSDLQVNATQATLVVDKDRASSLGITAAQLRSTLYSGFGSRQVSTIFGTGDSFSVVMEFNDKANWTTAELPDVRIRNSEGKLVPIGAFRADRTDGGLADHQPARAASRGDVVVQPAGRRVARARPWRASTS